MDIELRMRHINFISISLVIIVLTSRNYANGLKCYICKSTSPSSSCITNPADFSTTCTSRYCTIYRRELAEPTGIVTAFYRACEENPSYLNTEVSTPYATTYYRACESDLCNTGDGTADVSTISDAIRSSDSNIIVPGIGAKNDASNLHFGTVCAFVLIIVAYVMAMHYE